MKVLILTVKVGAGHNTIANILADKFIKNNHETKVHEIFSNDKFSTLVVSDVGFKLLFKFPHITNYFYTKAKKSDKHLYFSLNKRIKSELLNLINTYKPDVIISSHIAGYLFTKTYQEEFNKTVINYLVSTDFEITPGTADFKNNEYIVVPNEDFVAELVNKGFPKENILPYGIPVKSNFLTNINYDEALKNLNIKLDNNKLTILAMGKKSGMGKSLKIVKALSKYEDIQIINLAGSNESLKKKIDKISKTAKAKIFSLKFNNENIMTVADIMIGKTGGLSSCEALSKQVPIISLEYAPMPEYSNLLYLESKNIAFKLKNLKNLYTLIKKLDISEMKKNCLKIQKLNATDNIYEHVTKTFSKLNKH